MRVRERLYKLMKEAELTEGEVAKKVKAVLPASYTGPQVNQQWVSRRLTDGPSSVRLTIEDAILIAQALGRAAEFVIATEDAEPLVNAAANARPETVGVAIQMLRSLDALHPEMRDLVLATVQRAIAASAALTTG